MLKLNKYEDIIKIIRKFIIDEGKIAGERVLNNESVRGADLSKFITETHEQMGSINLNDAFIIFELKENEDSSLNFITKDKNGQMINISAYDFIIRCYGNGSHVLSKRLQTLFRVPDNASFLESKGVYVVGVSAIEQAKEFINNTVIVRCDFQITVQASLDISVKEDEITFREVQNVNLDVREL